MDRVNTQHLLTASRPDVWRSKNSRPLVVTLLSNSEFVESHLQDTGLKFLVLLPLIALTDLVVQFNELGAATDLHVVL